QGEDAIGRLLVVGGDDLHRRSGAAGCDQARDVDEAQLGAAGGDGADRVRRALRRHDGDVEAFVFEVALSERHVPGRMTAQADEIEDELEVTLLRLGGGAQNGY